MNKPIRDVSHVIYPSFLSIPFTYADDTRGSYICGLVDSKGNQISKMYSTKKALYVKWYK